MHEQPPSPSPSGASLAEMLAALMEGRLTAPERRRLLHELAEHPELRGWLARATLCLEEGAPEEGAPEDG